MIDDDKIYHFILQQLLNKNGIHVNPCFCENGLEALNLLKEKIEDDNVPDVILLDINMPIMNGWQFLEEFRKLKNRHDLKMPIYMISSSNDLTDVERAKHYQAEVSAYMVKPIDTMDLQKLFLN